MAGIVEGPAHARDIAGDTGRGFIVGDEDRLVSMRLIGLELLGEDFDRSALAPRHIDDIGIKPVADAHVGPQQRELAEAGDQHLVAGIERVGHGRFPAARARRRKQENLAAGGLEDFLQVLEQWQREGRKIRSALVLHGDVHGKAHGLRNIGRPRNEQSLDARHDVLLNGSGSIPDSLRLL